MTTLATVSIEAADVLETVRTIPFGNIATNNWLAHWVHSETFLELAEQGLNEGEAYGLFNAAAYCTRAAACRIDLLHQYNHLVPFENADFTTKIAALRQLGVSIPDDVHRLVADCQSIEYRYEVPGPKTVNHALRVAKLFIAATEGEYRRLSIVALGWNVLSECTPQPGTLLEYIHFRGFTDEPMLFIDVFNEPHAAKIVDPLHSQIRAAQLASFSREQSKELARLLRRNYAGTSGLRHDTGPWFFKEMTRQGRFD